MAPSYINATAILVECLRYQLVKYSRDVIQGGWIDQVNVQRYHGLDDQHQTLDCVGMNSWLVQLQLALGVPLVVQVFYLLENGGFSTLPRPKQQDLDDFGLLFLIPCKVPVNLFADHFGLRAPVRQSEYVVLQWRTLLLRV